MIYIKIRIRRLSVEKMAEPIRNRDSGCASLLYLEVCSRRILQYASVIALSHSNALIRVSRNYGMLENANKLYNSK